MIVVGERALVCEVGESNVRRRGAWQVGGMIEENPTLRAVFFFFFFIVGAEPHSHHSFVGSPMDVMSSVAETALIKANLEVLGPGVDTTRHEILSAADHPFHAG